MPRQARIDYRGALHHVIGRGVDRKHIFKTDSHKTQFYKRLKKNLGKMSISCYAWCIMGNHYHLLLQTGKTPLSEFMRSVLTGYAIYYNWRHKRKGYVFQNRYKSILCDRDEYLLPLIRYIHLNPVKAKMIEFESLEGYLWTGYRETCKGKKGLIKHKDEILSFYGTKKKEALGSYCQYVFDGVKLKEDFEGGGLIRSAGSLSNVLSRKKDEREMYDDRVLGDGCFVEEVYERIEEEEKEKTQIKSKEELLKKIAKRYQVNEDQILNSRVKEVREARDMYVLMSNRYLNRNMTEIGRDLKISQSAASLARQRANNRKEGSGEWLFK